MTVCVPRKAEVAAAMQVLQFCLRNTFNAFIILWCHMKVHQFTAVMRDNRCDPLLAVSPSVSSMPGLVMTSSDMPSSSSLTTPQPTTLTPSLSPEEGVWSKIMVTQEQAAELKGRLDINLNLFHGMRSAAVELRLLSLVESAGGFPVHRHIHL